MGEIKIISEKYLFVDGTKASDVNFFNHTDSKVLIDSFTFTEDNALINVSNIKYDRNTIISGDSNELVQKVGDVDVEFDTYNTNCEDYFSIKDTDSSIKRLLFYFWIFVDDVQVFFGTSTKPDITINYPNEEVVKVKMYSIAQNFITYLQNQLCDPDEVSYIGNLPPYNNSDYKYAKLVDLYHQVLFESQSFFNVVNNTGISWNIAKNPYFYQSSSEVYYWFFQNGFDRMTDDDVTKYDFFIKSCNAFGWDYKLYNKYLDNKRTVLSIQNRYNITQGIKSLDFLALNNITILNEFDKSGIEYIAIKDGYIKTGNYYASQGIPLKIISENITTSNKGRFFGSAQDKGDYYSLYPQPLETHYVYENAATNDNDVLDFGMIRYTDLNHWNSRINDRESIRTRNILFVDAGENLSGTVCDMATKTIYPADDIGDSTTDVYFRGNYGSMYFSTTNDGGIEYDYDKYSQTTQYRNNFQMVLSGKDKIVLDVEYDELLSDYYLDTYSIINFDNVDEEFYQGFWKILNVELNLKDETTKLRLMKVITG